MQKTKLEENNNNCISLDGKKFIFIGNSFVHHGLTVLKVPQCVLEQKERGEDKGYFYQLCRVNGEEVQVTSWTFGGHTLDDIFGGDCHADRGCDGVDHLSYLTDRDFDYVVISAGSRGDSDPRFLTNIRTITRIFREANPCVKFFYLCNVASYGISAYHKKQKRLLNALKLLEDMDVTVVDWGGLVTAIIDGKLRVPESKHTYDQNSFIIRKSEIDGFHPNLLSGYITSLSLYCAITGKSAVGQDYSFCNDRSLAEKFDFELYRRKHYSYDGAHTNFPEIFASVSDMRGIQTLIDAYLAEKSYRYYNY